METNKICPNCRKPLPPDVPLGLCPECLIKSGFPTEGGGGVGGEAAGARFVPPPVEEIARLFPQLEILGLIGKGGMGAVYKARQPALDRFVALKVLPPAVGSDPGFAERFNREARALARLNHPNIVAVHDFGKAGPLHYLVMEFVDGTNLREVEHAGRLSPEQALSIVPQICEALQFAHNEGIVHRDIKPENLLMDKRGRVKITDFGIAKIVGQPGGKAALTGAKDVVGTPHYMAPEQIEQPQTVDHRADIYSLGVVFYEMLTGELPLGKFAPPSRKVQMDVRLDEVVLHTLEKEPSRRYQHVSQVKTDVETIAGTLPPGAAGWAARAGAVPAGLPGTVDKTTSDKALLPAFLLAFFFGVFGAHRFYVGKIRTASLQLGALGGCILLIIACATTGARWEPTLGILLGVSIFGCIIWATIDWILILCKAFTDGQGRRMTYWLHPQDGVLSTSASPMGGPPSTPPPGGAAPPAAAGTLPPARVSEKSPAPGTGKIVAPAVGLMIAALWNLFSALGNALFFLPGGSRWLDKIIGENFLGDWGPMAIVSIVLFKLIPSLLILFGALQMLRLRSYAWAMGAAILSIVACSLVGFPVGIWALIILARQDVRETFANAAVSQPPRTGAKWPWILGIVAMASVIVVGLMIAAVLALWPAGGNPNLTVRGTVTDAVTGKPIAGARVDDNRYGADADKVPQQAWTDDKGHYKLKTWYEEHTIAASAPGYDTRTSTLLTKAFGSEREKRMDFKLQPQRTTPASAALTYQWRTGTNPPIPAEATTPASVAGPKIERVTVDTNQAVITGQGTRNGRIIFNIGKEGNWSCGFLQDTGFSATLTRKGDGKAGCTVIDAEGTRLLTIDRIETGPMKLSTGRFVFHEGTVASGADGSYVVADFQPALGEPRPVTVRVEKAAPFQGSRPGNSPATTGSSGTALNISSQNGHVVIETTNGRLSADKVQLQNDGNGAMILAASKIESVAPPPPPVPPVPPVPPTPVGTPSESETYPTRDGYQQDYTRTLPLAADGRVSLDNVNGKVTINGWDRNEVAIRAAKHGKSRDSVEELEIQVDASSGKINLRAKQTASWFGWKKDSAKVDYTVQVPRHARLANISSVNGPINIEGVSGNIEASTVNGQLQVRGATGDLKLSTVNGQVTAELVSLRRGQSVSLEAVNGQLEITLPADADAEVSASTVNGGLSSEFPALVVKKEFPLGRNLKGTLGLGGARVKASTVNGGIRFRQGKAAPKPDLARSPESKPVVSSPEALAARYEAAVAISAFDKRDAALAVLTIDAATAGDVALVKKALGKITMYDTRDKAAYEAAVMLARSGRRAEALEAAKTITSVSRRDAALRELAE